MINAFRCLAETPDWSYLDGRPAPLGVGQKQRYVEQIKYNMRIQSLLYQIDNAVDTVRLQNEEREYTKQQIISKKLRCKAKSWK